MVFVVLTTEEDEGGANPKVDEFQAKVDGLLGLSGDFSCEVSHRFSYCCKFYRWVHVDRIHWCNRYLFYIYPQFFESLLQVGILDDEISWIIHFSFVQAPFYPQVADLGEGRSKVCRGDYQPGWKLSFLVDCLMVLDKKFWIWDRSCCQRLSCKFFFFNWQF